MEVENLKAYLANINMTVKDFGEIIDCDPKYLSRLMNGKKYPSKRLSKDIRLATDGIIDLPTRPKLKVEESKKQEQQQYAMA